MHPPTLEPQCRECGYLLCGLEGSTRCPECGWQIDWAQARCHPALIRIPRLCYTLLLLFGIPWIAFDSFLAAQWALDVGKDPQFRAFDGMIAILQGGAVISMLYVAWAIQFSVAPGSRLAQVLSMAAATAIAACAYGQLELRHAWWRGGGEAEALLSACSAIVCLVARIYLGTRPH